MKWKRVQSLVLLVALAVILVAYVNRQAIQDWVRLLGYTPPGQVATFATDDTMTPYARHIFYVNKPDVAPKASFASDCPSGTEQTVVLGCYHSDQAGIYILSVSDPRLRGIEQVTAAHETLHAAYDRLSTKERMQVDSWLEAYYQHGLTDPVIKQQIQDYKQSEPNDVVNEMHSVFGTEIANLPAQLEQYYTRYFTNRAAITGMYANYQATFNALQSQIKQYSSQLSDLKTQVAANEASLSQQKANLNSQEQLLQQERSAGQVDTYNSQVAAYNQSVDTFNDLLTNTRNLIQQYNGLVAQYNNTVLEQQQIAGELSTTPLPHK